MKDNKDDLGWWLGLVLAIVLFVVIFLVDLVDKFL
jgi:hypothetical protein